MTKLTPFVLGRHESADKLAARCPVAGCAVLDVWSAEAEFLLLLAGNAESYGGMSMPAWVQLDCAALPAGIIGLGSPRAEVDDALYQRLRTRARALAGSKADALLDRHTGLVPLSQYTCVPTPEPGHVVGFSLFSLQRGLGLRTKAMALSMHRARRQTGVAQVGNRALQVHAALGVLHVQHAGVAVHDQAPSTIAYELALDDRDRMWSLARGGTAPRPSRRGTQSVAIDDQTVKELERRLQTGQVRIVDVDATHLYVGALRAS